jgi:hypothetical protein
LSRDEFETRIEYFYFGLFNEEFSDWNKNGNLTLEPNEFYNEISETNLATVWDTTGDKQITERELAGGMFYLSDADSDGVVNPLEFNAWKNNRKFY